MENTSSESAAQKAVRLLGGPVKAAEKLGVDRYQTVQSWIKHQVPAVHCPRIVELLASEMTLWDLRPDDWHRYWPMLIGTVGAPEVPADSSPAKAG